MLDVKITSKYAEAIFLPAVALDEEENFRPALAKMQLAAEQGFGPAMVYLGCMHCGRPGIRPNHSLALHWWKRALASKCDRGVASINIGLLYRDDYKNPRLAEMWLRRAISCGEVDAFLELAKLFRAKDPLKYARSIRNYAARVVRSGPCEVSSDDREFARDILSGRRTPLTRRKEKEGLLF
jgi:hypothetical protein